MGYTVYSYATGIAIQGWTTLMAVILILGSCQLLVLGVIGESMPAVRRYPATLPDGTSFSIVAAFDLDEPTREKIAARRAFRNEKKFADADAVRDALAAEGLILEDVPEGVRIKKK